MQPAADYLPSFFEVLVEWQGTMGVISFERDSSTLNVIGTCLPSRPRYASDVPLEIVTSPSGFQTRRPQRRRSIKPTEGEWNALWKIAQRIDIWSLCGTDDYLGMYDGAGARVDIEYSDRWLQTAITQGEHAVRWGIFEIACRALVGECRAETLRRLEWIWGSRNSEVDKPVTADVGQSAEPTTLAILAELVERWEREVTPPGIEVLSTRADWLDAARHWDRNGNKAKRQVCYEMWQASELGQVPSTLITYPRPWWTPTFRDQGPPCPVCGLPLRTPLAEQCFNCGADWH